MAPRGGLALRLCGPNALLPGFLLNLPGNEAAHNLKAALPAPAPGMALAPVSILPDPGDQHGGSVHGHGLRHERGRFAQPRLLAAVGGDGQPELLVAWPPLLGPPAVGGFDLVP